MKLIKKYILIQFTFYYFILTVEILFSNLVN